MNKKEMKRNYKVGEWIYPIENGTGTGFFNPKQWWLVEKWTEREKVYRIYKDYRKVMLIDELRELNNKGMLFEKDLKEVKE